MNVFQVMETLKESGMSKEIIRKLSNAQIGQIVLGFEDGLSVEQILTFAKPEIDREKMEQLRMELKNDLEKSNGKMVQTNHF